LRILSIQRRLSSRDIRINGSHHLSPLKDFPEEKETKEDWNADVGCQEIGYVPVRVVFTDEYIKSVEEENQGKISEGEPGGVGLEGRFED